MNKNSRPGASPIILPGALSLLCEKQLWKDLYIYADKIAFSPPKNAFIDKHILGEKYSLCVDICNGMQELPFIFYK